MMYIIKVVHKWILVLVSICRVEKVLIWPLFFRVYIDGLVEDCSNFIADALELLQSFT